MEEFNSERMSAEAALAALEPTPQPIPKPNEQWCRDFRTRWGWSMLTRSAEDSSHLPYDHCDMESSREAFRRMVSSGVDQRLILNFDQLWRNCWSTSHFRMSFKHRSQIGKRCHRSKVGARESKKITQVKGARRAMTATHPNNVSYNFTIACLTHI